MPGARQEGRARWSRRTSASSPTPTRAASRSQDLDATGGATGRATGRYVATYGDEPDVTGTITFGVLRDRGTPRIALISARQDPPRCASSRARCCSVTALPGSTCVPGRGLHLAHLRVARQERVEEAAGVLRLDLQPEPFELVLRGVDVAADDVGERDALLEHDPQRSEVGPPAVRAGGDVDQVRARLEVDLGHEPPTVDGDVVAEHLDRGAHRLDPAADLDAAVAPRLAVGGAGQRELRPRARRRGGR